MSIYIKKWYGRLGNNIQQLKHCISIALELNLNLYFPEHDFFKTTRIMLNNDESDQIGCNLHGGDTHFFQMAETLENNSFLPKDVFVKHKEETIKILKSVFSIETKDIHHYEESDLHIHIRSGDIFSDNPHPSYIQPPLIFYLRHIKENNFKNIYLISEDIKNPCANMLLDIYKNIAYQKQSLEEDVRMILGCRNIIYGSGMFVPSLLLLNGNNANGKNLFASQEYDEYRRMLYPWKNTQEQRNIMLNYGM